MDTRRYDVRGLQLSSRPQLHSAFLYSACASAEILTTRWLHPSRTTSSRRSRRSNLDTAINARPRGQAAIVGG